MILIKLWYENIKKNNKIEIKIFSVSVIFYYKKTKYQMILLMTLESHVMVQKILK